MTLATIPAALPRYAFSVDQRRRMRDLGMIVPAINGTKNGHKGVGSLSAAPIQFTVAEYDRLIEIGILTEDDRCELLEGEVVEKMAVGDLHIGMVIHLTYFFTLLFAHKVLVSVQNPIRLSASEPEPDIVLLARREDAKLQKKPAPAEILLLLEVADSSLVLNRDTKGPLYATAGIQEYWIVDVIANELTVYRDPRPDATWGIELKPKAEEKIEVLALPGVHISVADILGNK